jgi:hypothetical protein
VAWTVLYDIEAASASALNRGHTVVLLPSCRSCTHVLAHGGGGRPSCAHILPLAQGNRARSEAICGLYDALGVGFDPSAPALCELQGDARFAEQLRLARL